MGHTIILHCQTVFLIVFVTRAERVVMVPMMNNYRVMHGGHMYVSIVQHCEVCDRPKMNLFVLCHIVGHTIKQQRGDQFICRGGWC